MAQIRHDLHQDVSNVVSGVSEVVNEVSGIMDWRSALRGHPYMLAGAALAAGYLIVPRRKKVVVPSQDSLASLVVPETLPRKKRFRPTPMTSLGGLCLELLSGKGLESAFLEGIGLKHETVLCHHGAVFPKTPMETRTVPWLHRLRLPPRGHLPNGHNGEPSVLSRSRVRCVSFSPLKSGNKSNTPPASTVAGTGFAGHCNPSS